MRTAEIRQRFLDFFESKGHTIVPSASLVYNDPTLLFVNAGMVPFKPYFTGAEASPYRRAASVQKCVRTLDIEEVGKTTRHGTFFQMNGNFSFGDYFKEGAIEFAWDLITSPQSEGGYGFDGDRIWVTVLYEDDEAAELWKKIGVPSERIQRRGLKDNYWHMGVPGPGGPCSEIYIDRGREFGPDGGPEADEDRFLEIWNLVFQTEELSEVRAKDDFDVSRQLPSKNIDTGMGLERVAYLLQGVDNLYEIDEVYPVLLKAGELAGKKYHAKEADDVRMRVVADHVRSSLMLMTDGVTPGNEGRGYVLRRLLRRVIRSMWLLGVEEPVLPELLPVSRDLMHVSYPEIDTEWPRVSELAYGEEEAFRRTLKSGIAYFDMAVSSLNGAKQLPGETAFKLHDEKGFPIDITLEMAEEAGVSVDRAGFDKLMKEQKERAKADAKAKKGGELASEAYREIRNQGETPFLGYTELAVETQITGIISGRDAVKHASNGDIVEVVLRETPFYAEAGGQDADSGLITGDGLTLEVLDVQKPINGLIVHKVRVADGELDLGANVLAHVDADARLESCRAHTATHIVNAGLRQLLGQATHQQGSYNKPGYLRFDFNSAKGLSKGMQDELEGISNEAILADWEVTATEMPIAEAKALGAQAMFGEKYGEIVRMVELAGPWSRELCGGTHVSHTSEIGLLDLVSESSIGSGTRRVEAFVSRDAFTSLAKERMLVSNISNMLKARPDQLEERIGKLLEQLKQSEKKLADIQSAQLLAQAPALIAQAKQVGDYKFVSKTLLGTPSDDLRKLAAQIRENLEGQAGVVALVGGDGKPALVVATTAAARDKGAKAGSLVAVGAKALGGKGGGRDDLAQGGGTDSSATDAALKAIQLSL
ncbi:MAG: alanine--tRNA ligase [Propionibacteriaceae bacterium]|nr:alanine--tRNA ligase [Propionibacteriaceae bacterium]